MIIKFLHIKNDNNLFLGAEFILCFGVDTEWDLSNTDRLSAGLLDCLWTKHGFGLDNEP